MFGKIFGRRKHTAPSGGHPSVEDAPRLRIKASPKDADRLLRAYNAGQRTKDAPEKQASMDEPYAPKWWE